MAKKNQSTAKKKTKSNNSKGESLLEEINAKLKSSQNDLQKQVDELTSQVKTLSKDPSKKARKLFKSIEKSYHEKVAQLQNDFDKRMESVQKIQDKVIAQLPKKLAEKLNLKSSSPAKSPVKPAKTAKATAVKAKKSTAAKTPTIASINGIGPVIQKKLAAAGFTRLEDLANTPASKATALKQFDRSRGFNNWTKEAQALLAKK
jgi:predicted flap endonuclease-1-like 5' DNA nuclease